MMRPHKSPLTLSEEQRHQRSLMIYLMSQYPRAYAMTCASAGGLHTSFAQGAKMKAMGYRAGFPDVAVLYPSGKYHGLFIEMKSMTGTATQEQKDWIRRLNDLGYSAHICKGFDEAKEVVDQYMNPQG